MDREREILPVGDASELPDWKYPLSFMKGRHSEKIEGLPPIGEGWRVKERLKTWSVALALCLNIGVDPPDVVKTNPCARKECWIDPLSMSPSKAMEQIKNNLQKQYERWQPRARYKQMLDPTTEEVRKLCLALRKTAKNERVLFHYNGHGVPKPTTNGEIWVFNKSYTQYIPLSIYDLQAWMGKPSVYVFDCSQAGQIVDSFKMFARERESEFFLEQSTNVSNSQITHMGLLDGSILMAACGAKEMLPMDPNLPADLFTSCLTTPIKTALHWFCLKKVGRLIKGITEETIDKIPGKLNDRKTPLGELNWIFTAITDTIAWNTLSHELFQKLFRQDLLVASLFRNFLLAERVMRSYKCTPESHPLLPSTYHHPLWQAWDLAVDHIMAQLPALMADGSREYEPSSFFPEQLSAFQVWLISSPNSVEPPMQLPIILQFLLSQAHRLQALELLGRYLDTGPEAVHAALSVGIFPYVLKLLASKLRELQPILVFIWAKILAVDSSCQTDLVKEGGYKYFISVLSDPSMQYEYRTMAAFIISAIANNYQKGQEVCLKNNVISICLEQLEEPNSILKQWLAICLGRLWQRYDAARWCGVRDSAHDKLAPLLWDEVPEVRAAAVFALGTYIMNSRDGQQTEHATSIEHSVAILLLSLINDGCPLVRKELITALHGIILQYERQFQLAALRYTETEYLGGQATLSTSLTSTGWIHVQIDPPNEGQKGEEAAKSQRSPRPSSSPCANGIEGPMAGGAYASSSDSSSGEDIILDGIPHRVAGTQSFGPPVVDRRVQNQATAISSRGVYTQIWRGLHLLASDSCLEVSRKAGSIINSVHCKNRQCSKARTIGSSSLAVSLSAPSSPFHGSVHPNKVHTLGRKGSPSSSSPFNQDVVTQGSLPVVPIPRLQSVPPAKKFLSQQPKDGNDDDAGEDTMFKSGYSETQFCDWCCKYFANSLMKQPVECDPANKSYLQREYRFLRNHTVREEAKKLRDQLERVKISDQIFVNRETKTPQVLLFHPYQNQLVVLHKQSWSVWDVDQGTKLCTHSNDNLTTTSRITAAELINPHDISFLLTATDDGFVKVWRNYASDVDREEVTSWRAVSDMIDSPKKAGVVLGWEQSTGLLYATGDVRYIRVWDTHKEMKIQDIPTGADSCITCLALASHSRSVLATGCGDGTVRLYDKRTPSPSSLMMTLKEHKAWVLNVQVQEPTNNIISASVEGDVRIWDTRFTKSTRIFSTMSGSNLNEIHSSLPLLACASQQAIKLYNTDQGELISSVKYHDGFMGQRIGPTKSLVFHPYKLWMAAGGADGLISIYSLDRKK